MLAGVGGLGNEATKVDAVRELAASCGCLLKVNATGKAVRRSVFLSADQRFLQWAPSKKTDTASFSEQCAMQRAPARLG